MPEDEARPDERETEASEPDGEDALEREIQDALGDTSLLGIDRRASAGRGAADAMARIEVPETREPEPGAFAKAQVAGVGDEDVFVEFGPRAQGVVKREHFGTPPEVGDTIRVFVETFDTKEGLYLCSLKRGLQAAGGWEGLEVGAVVLGKVRATNKGGLEVQVGHLSAFMPASHAALGHVEDLETLVGEAWPVEVIEVDEERRRCVVSRRAVLARERDEKQATAMRTLAEGDIVSGTVSRVEPFGAFVDLGGVDGLVHVSQMAWERVEDPTALVKPGDVVKVQVLGVDPEEGRIALGMKQLTEDPWLRLVADHPVGSLVEGKVTRIEHYGAFIEIAPGVEGLAHVSQLAPHRVDSPREVLSVGQTVGVRVANVEPERRRIGLSLLTERGDRLTDDVADDATIREVMGRGADDVPEPTLGDLLRKAMEEREGS